MRIATIIAISVLSFWALMTIAVLWLPDTVVSGSFYIKATVTCAIIIFLTIIIALGVREYVDDKEMKKNGFIDE